MPAASPLPRPLFRAARPRGERPAVQAKSKHPIEPGEMVHVAVGNENVADPQHLPRRKRREIAGIEQQGAPAEAEVNEQAGIAERIVHQPSLDQLAHANSKRAE